MPNKESIKIFVVEDDDFYGELLKHHLSLNPDYVVKRFRTGKAVIDHLHENPSIVTLDYSLPDMTGEDILKTIKKFNPSIPVIIISGQENISTAIQLLKEGAYDYIVKDEEAKDRVWNAVNNARKILHLENEVEQLREEIAQKYDFQKFIVGKSPAMAKVFSLMEKASKTNITVSITGETGTGKEMVAKGIHYNSARKKNPFVAVNVSAIPNGLVESELFGHEKGAFTGADTRRIGKFESANEGTLFLDEIGDMEISMQAKLLRVLQEREITRVGGNEKINIDVRIIIATHKDLQKEVKNKNFREDLFYRLLGLPISLPPLRNRNKDVLLLANHFIEAFCKENNMKKIKLSSEAQDKLMNYPWPGNVRELKAVMDLAVVMNENNIIQKDGINFTVINPMGDILVRETTLRDYTNKIIKNYLAKYNDNVTEVAKKLDIGKSTIYRVLKEEEEKTKSASDAHQ